MKQISKVFEFYIHSNLHVSFAVFSMVVITGISFELDTRNEALLIGFSTFMAYNVIRYLKFKKNQLKKDIYSWVEENFRILCMLNTVAGCFIVYLLWDIELRFFLVLVPFMVFTLFYMVPVLKIENNKYSLRKLPMAKIFTISISWSGLVGFFPMIVNSVIFEWEHILFIVHQFLFVIVLTLPFDLRDVGYDSSELKTLPMLLGERYTKILGSTLLVAISILSFVLFDYLEWGVNLLVYIVLLIALWKSSTQQSKYFASFWIEAIPVLWMFLLIGFQS